MIRCLLVLIICVASVTGFGAPDDDAMAHSKAWERAANSRDVKTMLDLYALTAPFVDFDGVTHPVGESWRFLGKDFLPYEDGLTLFLERDGKPLWLRLQWRRETQGDVIDNFSDFVEEI